jgi:hypothetical protein
MNNPILALIPRQDWHKCIRADWVSWADVQEIIAVGLPDKTHEDYERAKENLDLLNCAHNLDAPYEIVADTLARCKVLDKYHMLTNNQIFTTFGYDGALYDRHLINHPSIPIESISNPERLFFHPAMSLEWFKRVHETKYDFKDILNTDTNYISKTALLKLYSHVRTSHIVEDIAWIDQYLENIGQQVDITQKWKHVCYSKNVFIEDIIQQLPTDDVSIIMRILNTTYNTFLNLSTNWPMLYAQNDRIPILSTNWIQFPEKFIDDRFVNYNLTIDDVKSYYLNNNEEEEDWTHMSMNPNMTLDIIRANKFYWDWDYVCSNPSLTVDDIKWLADNGCLNIHRLSLNRLHKDPYYTIFKARQNEQN